MEKSRSATKLDKMKAIKQVEHFKRTYNIKGQIPRKDIALALQYLVRGGKIAHYGQTKKGQPKRVTSKQQAHELALRAKDILGKHARVIDVTRVMLPGLNRLRYQRFQLQKQVDILNRVMKDTKIPVNEKDKNGRSAIHYRKLLTPKSYSTAAAEVSKDIVKRFKSEYNASLKKYYQKHPDQKPSTPVKKGGHTFASLKQAKQSDKPAKKSDKK